MKTILVPLDGSALAEQVLPYVRALALLLNSRIHLMRVLPNIEPDNVFILPEYRRQGLAKQLLDWVYDYGKTRGCIASELNCYVANDTGNAFWEQEGFAKIGYHYQKQLED